MSSTTKWLLLTSLHLLLLVLFVPQTVWCAGSLQKDDDQQTIFERIQELVDEIGPQGSMDGMGTMTFHEYHMAIEAGLDAASIRPFQLKLQRLDQLLAEFARANPLIGQLRGGDQLMQMVRREMAQRSLASEATAAHRLIISCKVFMIRLYSAGEPGGWLDLETFMGQSRYALLQQITTMARMQNGLLDVLARRTLVEKHHQYRQKGLAAKRNSRWHRALIEGAGCSGLMAAFHLFMAGMDVTIVNDRKDYIRNHPVILDIKFMVQLSYFLGTEYGKLFLGKTALGEIQPSGLGRVNLKHLETALRNALQGLADFAARQFGGDESHLRLYYEVEFMRIEETTGGAGGYHAILRQTQSGQLMAPAPFDLLLCAGGAHDRIRNANLAAPSPLSYPKNYSKCILLKENRRQKVFDFGQDTYLVEVDDMETMRPFLIRQQFTAAFLRSPFLTRLFGKYASNFVASLVQERRNESSRDRRMQIHVFENQQTVSIISETPAALETIMARIEEQKGRVQPDSAEYRVLSAFRSGLERKWFSAMYEYAYRMVEGNGRVAANGQPVPLPINLDSNGEPGPVDVPNRLNFDPYSANSSTFPFVIEALTNPTKLLPAQQGMIAAIGDANLTPHFLVGNGLSLGRHEAENLSQLVANYHSDRMTEVQLNERIRQMLTSVHRFVLENAAIFVQLLPSAIERGGATYSGAGASSSSVADASLLQRQEQSRPPLVSSLLSSSPQSVAAARPSTGSSSGGAIGPSLLQPPTTGASGKGPASLLLRPMPHRPRPRPFASSILGRMAAAQSLLEGAESAGNEPSTKGTGKSVALGSTQQSPDLPAKTFAPSLLQSSLEPGRRNNFEAHGGSSKGALASSLLFRAKNTSLLVQETESAKEQPIRSLMAEEKGSSRGAGLATSLLHSAASTVPAPNPSVESQDTFATAEFAPSLMDWIIGAEETQKEAQPHQRQEVETAAQSAKSSSMKRRLSASLTKSLLVEGSSPAAGHHSSSGTHHGMTTATTQQQLSKLQLVQSIGQRTSPTRAAGLARSLLYSELPTAGQMHQQPHQHGSRSPSLTSSAASSFAVGNLPSSRAVAQSLLTHHEEEHLQDTPGMSKKQKGSGSGSDSRLPVQSLLEGEKEKKSSSTKVQSLLLQEAVSSSDSD